MLTKSYFCPKTVRLLAIMGMTAAMFGFAGQATAQSPAAGFHVTICHRTGSANNPYIVISPDVEGVVNGHFDHEQTGNGLGGDIVPEFNYKGVVYSKNLSTDFGNGVTGAAILAAGCRIPAGRTPRPTPKSTPPTGPTPPPTEPVPEPMTLILFGTGLAAVGAAARRRFGKKTTNENDPADDA
jgi:hypothetical protein